MPKTYPKWYLVDHVQPGELVGWLRPQYVRCGKSNCRCNGRDLHGPYWYRCWRDATGRQRKIYVKQSALPSVQAAIRRRQRRLTYE